jgi:hypothetical protein
MSNKTGFLTIFDELTYDLSDLFQPRNGTTEQQNTGFIASNGKDLSDWFQAYDGSDPTISTNYIIKNTSYPNGIDLNLYFKKLIIISYYSSGNDPAISGTINGKYYSTILKFTSGSNNIFKSYISNLEVNYFILGGGATGLTGSWNSSQGGNGGGAGQYINNLFNAEYNTEYTLVIGNSDSESSIKGGSISIIAIGGDGSTSGNGYTNGNISGGNGGGGGGATSNGNGRDGGNGIGFFGTTFGRGGNGGPNYPVSGGSPGANTGSGGNGGGGANPPNIGQPGGRGGSGIIFLYFNI